MASGSKRLQINPSERAVSVDINRLQQFEDAANSADWQALSDTNMGSDDDIADGFYSPNLTQGTPLAGEVHNGLLVSPQIGAAQLAVLVSSGVAYVFDPDAPPNTDDSQYKRIVDPGVSIVGALLMTANASGSIRIDVIECARATLVLETDNRDVFDPVTGLFTAQVVNKVVADQLTYRVRVGTPGAGWPGFAAGWLPLCVASVPNGAAGNDVITFWDVRPLVAARIFAPHNRSLDFPRCSDIELVCDEVANAPNAVLTGFANVTGRDVSTGVISPYRLGGRVRRGTPGTDAAFGIDGVNLSDAANQSASFTAAAVNYVYLLAPFGLPWARYTDAASGLRRPRAPRGILTVSATPPDSGGFAGPSAPIALPVSTGLGAPASTGFGCCIGAYLATVNQQGFYVHKGRHESLAFSAGSLATVGTVTGPVASIYTVNWNLVEGTTHPAHAKAIWFELTFDIQVPPTTSTTAAIDLLVVPNAVYFLRNHRIPFENFTGATVDKFVSILVRVPIVSVYPSHAGVARQMRASILLNPGAVFSGAIQTLGFET
jgi:hypothetical protein